MGEMKDAALGIDLGTTSCVVSVVINGKVEVIPNRRQNSNVTPSYVCYRDGKETFGVVAKDEAYRYPECTIFNVKRIIGRTWGDPVLLAEIKQWPFEVKNVNGFPKVKIGNRTKYPQEISGRLLEIFCREAEAYLQMQKGSVTKAVITVPANFNDLQRRATIEAGENAGIEVLDLLNEPTAAAIAYKFEGRSEQKTKTLLIYDLGGGTFDVAIIKVTDNCVLCLSIDGDTHLGGEDFDNAMVTHCAAKFETEVGINLLEQKDIFKSAVTRLRLECEKAKMALSSCEIYPIEVQCIYKENDLSVEVSRAEFEALIKPHVEKTIEIVNRAIQNSKDIRSSGDIDEIILIGGSTRIPLVHKTLGNSFSGKPLNFAIDPELTVSRGAAVHAAILSGTCKGVKIQDFELKEQPLIAKKTCFEESAVFKEINNDMKKLAISLGYNVSDIEWIWVHHFNSVKKELETGQCICGTISCVDWSAVGSRPNHFKAKYESILKRAVHEFNERPDSASQDCFCSRVFKKTESVKHFNNVLYKALRDLSNLPKTSGYDSEIFGEIAETCRDFFKENVEKNICICSTFHCPDWKLVNEKSGRAFTKTFTQRYGSILKDLTDEFNKHHDEDSQNCFCRTMTRPLLVEMRLSTSKKGAEILKKIAELKASANETFKMLNIFSRATTFWDFVRKLTKENCMCKTLLNWIWEEVCHQSPRMKQESLFQAKFETTFQRAVEEFNKLRKEENEDCFCRTFTGFQEEKYIHMTLQSRANGTIHDLCFGLKLFGSCLLS